MTKKLFENAGGNVFKLTEYRTNTYDTVVTNPETGEDINITVEYDYVPAEKGLRPAGERQMSPDYAAQVIVNSATDENGNEYPLSDFEREKIEDKILNLIQSRH